jgi:hypothetical protein
MELKVFGKEDDMLELDINKCRYYNQHHGVYSVVYKTHQSECGDFEPITLAKKSGDACYSGFFSRRSQKDNRITTTIKIPNEPLKLNKEQAERWLDLCIENDLMPKYIAKQTIFDDEFKNATLVLDIEEKFQGTIYIYLDSFRKIREDPGFIKAIIYMCDEKDVDFHIAYVIATHLNIKGAGHHILPFTISNHYDTWNGVAPKDLKTGAFNLKACRALYKFLHDPDINRNSIIGKNATRWRVNPIIKEIVNKNLLIPIKHINNPKVIAIVHEFDEERALEMHKEFMKEIKEE